MIDTIKRKSSHQIDNEESPRLNKNDILKFSYIMYLLAISLLFLMAVLVPTVAVKKRRMISIQINASKTVSAAIQALEWILWLHLIEES